VWSLKQEGAESDESGETEDENKAGSETAVAEPAVFAKGTKSEGDEKSELGTA
jgi:hypothetical protein